MRRLSRGAIQLSVEEIDAQKTATRSSYGPGVSVDSSWTIAIMMSLVWTPAIILNNSPDRHMAAPSVDVVTVDTMIAFAAKAGSTAADGTGSNSPDTTALLRHLATPGLDVRQALGRVRD